MKNATKMLVMLSVAVLLVAATAQAAVVNVDFEDSSLQSAATTYVGLAAAPDAAGNTLWNSVSASGATDLTASDGSGTTIDVSVSGTSGFGGPSPFHSGNTNLTGDRATANNTTATFTISGLANSASYDIYLYNTHFGTAGWFGTDYTIGTTTLNANDAGAPPTATDGTGWTLGDDYVKFSVTSSASGVITGSWTTDAGGSTWGMLSGMQIVPEPATMSLLGIGGLLALVRRKR